MSRIGWIACAALAACGESEATPPRAELVIPFRAALTSCPNSANLAGMTATMFVGGHAAYPCPLALDAEFNASGTCPNVILGLPRPLLIVYDLPVDTRVAQVAYNIGSVDLSP